MAKSSLILNVFGPDQLVTGNPVTYVSPAAPPFLIIHGDTNPVIPVEQAYLFHEALLKAWVSSELQIVNDGGHGLEPFGDGNITPSGDALFEQIIRFLNQNLQPEKQNFDLNNPK